MVEAGGNNAIRLLQRHTSAALWSAERTVVEDPFTLRSQKRICEHACDVGNLLIRCGNAQGASA